MAVRQIAVKRLNPLAKLPTRATEGASGFDLYACLEDGPILVRSVPVMVPTGLALEAPPGLDVQIRPRSGLARRGVLCTFGTIDADYRGELIVTMYTTSPEVRHEVQHGDRIAQIVVSELAKVAFSEVEVLGASVRGEGGHGSTGR